MAPYLLVWNTDICSGNGVIGTPGDCLCELKWTGKDCSKIEGLPSSDLLGSWAQSGRSLLFVTHSFGYLQPENELSSFYRRLVSQLAMWKDESGNAFKVTILYTGRTHPMFEEYSQVMNGEGISLVQ